METLVIIFFLFLVLTSQYLLYKKLKSTRLGSENTLKKEELKVAESDLPQENRNKVSSLIIHDKNEVEKIEFEMVTDLDFSKYEIVPMSPNSMGVAKNLMSNLVGASANIGIASQMTRGLFKATASPEKLMKLANGGYGSAIMENGKIAGHAGFVKAGSALLTPLIVFQIASIITGQYFLKNISKQLNVIQEKLDELINLFHIERRAKLKRSFIMLKEYASRKSFEFEDFVLMKSIMAELLSIREEYYLMLEDMLETFDENFKSNAFRALTQAKEIINNVNKSGFLYKLNLSLTADHLYHLAKIIELHMNLSYKEPTLNRINIIKNQIDEFKAIKEDDLMFSQTKTLYNIFKKKINDKLKEAERSSIFYKDEIKILKKEFKKDFSEFEKTKQEKARLILKNYQETVKPFEQQYEIIIDVSPERVLIYSEKS